MVGCVGSNELKKLSSQTRLNPRLKIKVQPNLTHQFTKNQPKVSSWVGSLGWWVESTPLILIIH